MFMGYHFLFFLGEDASRVGFYHTGSQAKKELRNRLRLEHTTLSQGSQFPPGESMRSRGRQAPTEVIEVTLSQMEETGISRFECPTCLAVRDIKPKGDRVKFPSHPKPMHMVLALPNF